MGLVPEWELGDLNTAICAHSAEFLLTYRNYSGNLIVMIHPSAICRGVTMEQEPVTPQTATMDDLTEDEKTCIKDAPDKILKTLYDFILNNGLPDYFVIMYRRKDGSAPQRDFRFEGIRMLAVFDYVDHLVETGVRTDPYE